MSRMIDSLRSIRPLDPGDPDFPVAVDAMESALRVAAPGGMSFWLVDNSAEAPADMVAVIDVAALGRMAISDPGTWDERAATLRVTPLHDRDAMRATLESVILLVRDARLRAAVPAP